MEKPRKVVFCTPSLRGPTAPYLDALEAAIPLIIEAGWEEGYAQRIGCPYISHARGEMTRQALDAKADVIVYLDYDVSFRPEDLLKLIETEGDVVAGLYRYKKDEEEYMGTIKVNPDNTPRMFPDGCIVGDKVPAGFLKLTKFAVQKFMIAYPELLYGDPDRYSVDLFNHGAYQGLWYGEDYAFSRRWHKCGEIKILPDLSLTHHSETKAYPGNYHEFMLAQPGGSNAIAA